MKRRNFLQALGITVAAPALFIGTPISEVDKIEPPLGREPIEPIKLDKVPPGLKRNEVALFYKYGDKIATITSLSPPETTVDYIDVTSREDILLGKETQRYLSRPKYRFMDVYFNTKDYGNIKQAFMSDNELQIIHKSVDGSKLLVSGYLSEIDIPPFKGTFQVSGEVEYEPSSTT